MKYLTMKTIGGLVEGFLLAVLFAVTALVLTAAMASVAKADVPAYPAGAAATGCDLTGFAPVLKGDGTVAYWTVRNDLCPAIKDDIDDKLAEAERLAAKD